MTIVLLLAVLIGLFLLAFFTKRRFGVLGLSLAAGVVLSQYAARYLTQFYESNQLSFGPLSYNSASIITLTVLPALMLLISGPKYSTNKSAMVGSIGFALLGMFFIAGPLTASLPPAEPLVRDILLLIGEWENLIVVIALALALVDTFMVHNLSIKKPKSKKH